MSWRTDSSCGAHIWDTEPMTTDDLALRDEEIAWLTQKGRHQWKLVNGRIARKGDPVAAVGAYSALGAYPPVQAQTSSALATTTPGTCFWTSTIWTPILANAVTAAGRSAGRSGAAEHRR
mgnify:CR=1 FL=1